LSQELEKHFSGSTQPTNYTEQVSLDCQGYYQICDELYDFVAREDNNLRKSMAKCEFLAVCGFLIAHRVLYTRNATMPLDVPGYLDFDRAMRAVTELPGPIHNYLIHVGTYKDVSGRNVVPTLVLPVMNDPDGVLPSDSSSNWSLPNMAGLSSMYPYGFLDRECYNHKRAAGTPVLQRDRFNPLSAGADAPLNRPGVFVCDTGDTPDQVRRDQMSQVPQGPLSNPLFTALRFRGDLVMIFTSFCQRLHRYVKMYPMPSATTGSPCQQVIAVPRDGTSQVRPEHYDYFTYQDLTSAELQLSRIFLMRVRRDNPLHRCYPGLGAEVNYNANHCTEGYRGNPPLQINALNQRTAALTIYINFFSVHRKN